MKELSKTYDPTQVEGKWYSFWENEGLFIADPHSEKPPFSIVMPPPNVTGILHMGHVLGDTLQDVICRWKRMQGFEVLWVPGTDHAGIATQTVVEKHLKATYGKGRKDYTREEFLSHVWEWKKNHENRIIEQIKSIGCSCDWSRLRFTMDENINVAVCTLFKKLYEEGLIYQGDYLVNWDPVTQTALADDEVEYEDRSGHLWYFSYPIKDSEESIMIATTRPETMLGDTAVAVSPKDTRYAHLIGKMLMHPITEREIPIIADPFVDPEFGTGAVKITPAHDPNDYEMGLRHELPFINIMNPDGTLNENGLQFQDLSMAEARIQVIETLKNLGHLVKIEKHAHRVGISYRSKAIIEPYLSKQWFVKMKGFANKLKEVVHQGQFDINPKNWESTYFHWLDNLRDWCISRQLWWGHRIPVWYHKDNPEKQICHAGPGLPPEVEASPSEWYQDEDVLDTWFSSALWPFSTLGWPENTDILQNFYPNSLLITGNDILFFWVTRMLLMGDYAMGKLPFPKVLLTGLIFGKSYWRVNEDRSISYVSQEERLAYDLGKPIPKDVHSKWEKISKSKGNAIDPKEIVELYGTDAMRMALCASPVLSHQIDLDRRKFEEFKNFSNKIWNGARFVFMNLIGNSDNPEDRLTGSEFSKGLVFDKLFLEDKWILSRLSSVIQEMNELLEQFAFDKAALLAYNFYWNDFCSQYVEIIKLVLFKKFGSEEDRRNKQRVLVIVLTAALRLLHPMTPFITEELFQSLKSLLGSLDESSSNSWTQESIKALNSLSIMIAPYPNTETLSKSDSQIEDIYNTIHDVIYTIRNIRGEMKIGPGIKTDIYILGPSKDNLMQLIQEHQHILLALLPIHQLHFVDKLPTFTFSSHQAVKSIQVVIPLPDELAKKEQERLEKELAKVDANLEKVKQQLNNPEFVDRAPEALVAKQKALHEELLSKRQRLQEQLAQVS